MIYSPQAKYFAQTDFDFDKALKITASFLGLECNYYRAQLLVPKRGTVDTKKEGEMPPTRKGEFISQLVDWKTMYSRDEKVFSLFLDEGQIAEEQIANRKIPKFAYFQNVSSWFLNLSESEFAELQKQLQKNGLPNDLFVLVDLESEK